MTVIAILIAAMLAKLGLEWWAIAAMVALCLLAGVRKVMPAMNGGSHAIPWRRYRDESRFFLQ